MREKQREGGRDREGERGRERGGGREMEGERGREIGNMCLYDNRTLLHGIIL